MGVNRNGIDEGLVSELYVHQMRLRSVRLPIGFGIVVSELINAESGLAGRQRPNSLISDFPVLTFEFFLSWVNLAARCGRRF